MLIELHSAAVVLINIMQVLTIITRWVYAVLKTLISVLMTCIVIHCYSTFQILIGHVLLLFLCTVVSPPLTYEAAYNVVKNVRAENWDTFRVWLLHRGHVSTGDTDNHHPHDCLSITVKTWIKNGQDVTWRHLLLSLHAAGELLLGSALWSYAEPQEGV